MAGILDHVVSSEAEDTLQLYESEIDNLLNDISAITFDGNRDMTLTNNVVRRFSRKFNEYCSQISELYKKEDWYSDRMVMVADVLSNLITNLRPIATPLAERIIIECCKPMNIINNFRVIFDVNSESPILLQAARQTQGDSYIPVRIKGIYSVNDKLRIVLKVQGSKVGNITEEEGNTTFELDQIVLNRQKDVAGRPEIIAALSDIDVNRTISLGLKVIGGTLYTGIPKGIFQDAASVALSVTHIDGAQVSHRQYITIDASQITDIDEIKVGNDHEIVQVDMNEQALLRTRYHEYMAKKYPEEKWVRVSRVPDMTRLLGLIPDLHIMEGNSRNYYAYNSGGRRIRSSVNAIYTEGVVSYPVTIDSYDTGKVDVRIRDMKGGANKSRIINKLSGKIRDTLRGLREFEN